MEVVRQKKKLNILVEAKDQTIVARLDLTSEGGLLLGSPEHRVARNAQLIGVVGAVRTPGVHATEW